MKIFRSRHCTPWAKDSCKVEPSVDLQVRNGHLIVGSVHNTNPRCPLHVKALINLFGAGAPIRNLISDQITNGINKYIGSDLSALLSRDEVISQLKSKLDRHKVNVPHSLIKKVIKSLVHSVNANFNGNDAGSLVVTLQLPPLLSDLVPINWQKYHDDL